MCGTEVGANPSDAERRLAQLSPTSHLEIGCGANPSDAERRLALRSRVLKPLLRRCANPSDAERRLALGTGNNRTESERCKSL